MSDASEVRIENVARTEFGSDLLQSVVDLARGQSHGQDVKINAIPKPGQKGEIITTVILGLVVSAVYDILKTAAIRLASHPLYDDLVQLNINGKSCNLKDLDLGILPSSSSEHVEF